ncbi:MAG: twin-arginine translocase TatA/TatE family subunit [Bdellovibrionales bacterium]|nr:twin-arginine translocase TatA/TatE family subunit [Bdellovibrionales bacterium]
MFNIGFSELIVIGVVALLVIGPKQLPDVARVVGRVLGELKKATEELSGGLLEVTRDVQNTIQETKNDIAKQGQQLIDELSLPPDHEIGEDEKLELAEEESPQDQLEEKANGKSEA